MILTKDARGFIHRWEACGPTFTDNLLKAHDFDTRDKALAVIKRHPKSLEDPIVVEIDSLVT